MCFSAAASFTSGAIVGGIGVATLPMVRSKREIPFAALPLLFGAHQLLEGVIWTQLDRAPVGASIRSPAVIVWLFIAWTLFPICVPVAVALFEPDPRRRRLMYGLAGLGAATGILLLVSSIALGSTVHVDQHHLRYNLTLNPTWVFALPYVAATCLPMLLSTHRFVITFGIVLTAAMGLTAAVSAWAFSSVWCFFAAILSAGLFLHYFAARSDERPSIDMAST
jgi:hypothetical protein